MSLDYLNKALKVEGLTPTKKFILIILSNYADEKGQCYPSHRHIANIIGLKDTKGVQKAIKEFEQLGYLRIEHRKKDDGGFTSNRYTLLLTDGLLTPKGAETLREEVQTPNNTKDDTKTNNNNEENEKWFENFWKIYPRKVGKFQARKCYLKYDSKIFPKLNYAVELFKKEQLNTDPKFIPHASTWLNQQRYLDYLNKPTNNNLNNLAG